MLDTPTRLTANPASLVARVRTAIVAVFFINGLTLSTLAYSSALELVANDAERRFLERRLRDVRARWDQRRAR
jgi:hypothetical protein